MSASEAPRWRLRHWRWAGWSLYPHKRGRRWRAVTPCSREARGNCGVDRGWAEIYGGIVGDWCLLLIRHTHSSRQAVEAKQPWQLIGSSSCQVPLGNCLKLQSGYLVSILMHVSVRWSILNITSHASESKLLVNRSVCSFLSQGLGGKPGPRGQRGPTVGIPAAHQPSMHPPRYWFIQSKYLLLCLGFSVRNTQPYKLSVQGRRIRLLFFYWTSVQWGFYSEFDVL